MGKFILNKSAYSNARRLINAGKIDRGVWDFNWARDVKDPEKFGKEYCLGHLPEGDPATKAFWGYPFGKNGKVYRKSLAAIMGYANKNGETDIYEAARNLADLADKMLGKETESIPERFIKLARKARYKHKLLNIGKKKYRGEDWDVTYDYLKKLAENTKKALGLGLEIPVTVSHPAKVEDYTKNKIGNLIDLELNDTWLWGIFEIDDKNAIAKIEDGTWDKVSVGIAEFETETVLGEKVPPPYIDHVAITAINAIPDQGVFIKLEQRFRKFLEDIKGLFNKNVKEDEAPVEFNKNEKEDDKEMQELEKTKKELEQIKFEYEKLRKELSEKRRKEFEIKVNKYIEQNKLTPAVKEDAILLFDYLEPKTDTITVEKDKELTPMNLFERILDNLPTVKVLEGKLIENPLNSENNVDKEKLARKLAGIE